MVASWVSCAMKMERLGGASKEQRSVWKCSTLELPVFVFVGVFEVYLYWEAVLGKAHWWLVDHKSFVEGSAVWGSEKIDHFSWDPPPPPWHRDCPNARGRFSRLSHTEGGFLDNWPRITFSNQWLRLHNHKNFLQNYIWHPQNCKYQCSNHFPDNIERELEVLTHLTCILPLKMHIGGHCIHYTHSIPPLKLHIGGGQT